MGNNDQFELTYEILNKMIYEIRGERVMIDSDLASIFGYETKYFNRHVKNNINLFTENNRFILTKDELDLIIENNFCTANDKKCTANTDFVTANSTAKRRTFPYAFTIDGIKILSKILKPKTDIIRNNIQFLNEFLNKNVFSNENKKWPSEAKNCELVRFEDGEFSLDVNVSPYEETIWLTINQLADLYETTKNNIIMHIDNIYDENELDKNSTGKDFLTVQIEGGHKVKRVLKYYNFDMLISIGYRVKSKRGYEFRKWATNILKKYMFSGSVFNEKRCLDCQSNIISLNKKYDEMNDRLNSFEKVIDPGNEKIFFEGEIIEAYSFLRKIFFLAKKELIIIDNYADKFLLTLLEDIKVKIIIITSMNSYIDDKNTSNNIKIIKTNSLHGRYIIADDFIYLIDNSINSIGKKGIYVARVYDFNKNYILKLANIDKGI